MSETNCLKCKHCIADPEVGYDCGLNDYGNLNTNIHGYEYQSGKMRCPDFELETYEKEEADLSIKDYCITYTASSEKNIEDRLQKIKQTFLKLSTESAKKLTDIFSLSSDFIIEEFKY